MTRKWVWRYFCDFCGKGSLSGGHMKKHEKHCTANPDRSCRMHANLEGIQVPVKQLIAAINPRLPDRGLADLRRLAENCPMCILAAIRQSGIGKWDGDPENPPITMDFDFEIELAAAWERINKAKAQAELHGYR